MRIALILMMALLFTPLLSLAGGIQSERQAGRTLTVKQLHCEGDLYDKHRRRVKLRKRADGLLYDKVYFASVNEWSEFTCGLDDKLTSDLLSDYKNETEPMPGIETSAVVLYGYLVRVHGLTGKGSWVLELTDRDTKPFRTLFAHIPPGLEYCKAREVISDLINEDIETTRKKQDPVFMIEGGYSFSEPPEVAIGGYPLLDVGFPARKLKFCDANPGGVFRRRESPGGILSERELNALMGLWVIYPVFEVRKTSDMVDPLELVPRISFLPVFRTLTESTLKLKSSIGKEDNTAASLLNSIEEDGRFLLEQWRHSSGSGPKEYFDSLNSIALTLKGLADDKTVVGELQDRNQRTYYTKLDIFNLLSKQISQGPQEGQSKSSNRGKHLLSILGLINTDLQLKRLFFSQNEGGWPIVRVIINTLRKSDRKPVQNLSVYYAPLLVKDDPLKWKEITKPSSPTGKDLVAGLYQIGLAVGQGKEYNINEFPQKTIIVDVP
jgi:hypothetical protein